MKVYSFPRGGVSFDDPTVPSRDASVVAFLPAFSIIPLTQYPGGRVDALVSVGNFVREGMLVGRGKNSDAANIHATIPGQVVRSVEWNDNEGRPNEALVIRLEGSFKYLGKKEENFLRGGVSRKELLQILTDYGIVEMESSGRPVAGMLAELDNTGTSQTLVVRCVFDDPWLAADYVVCRERLQAVVEGSCIIAMNGAQIKRIIFAVSHKEKEIGDALLSAAAQYDIPSAVILTGSRYPQRNRRELELALRGYEKKEGVDLGALLILGPATLAAVYDAVKYHRPILDRYVAVGGSAVRNPRVMLVRIGKRIGDLFEECGGFVDVPYRVATGSPLSGKPVVNLDEPVTKTSYAVFAMLRAQAGDGLKRNCISCGECRNVCPVGLDPEELYKRIMVLHSAHNPGAQECHGCGCCDLMCPSHLPLSDVIMGRISGESA
ncbi:MAG: SLBB domain-containing protein [Treponema sp.]|jgi:electron transport complex protein RnfC|nr:SLBB domain-containing protein [Treponema sp.]